MRTYELRALIRHSNGQLGYSDVTVQQFDAENLEAARQFVEKHDVLAGEGYCQLIRLANAVDGPEKCVWTYPASPVEARPGHRLPDYAGPGGEDE
jgi:hypothetical protein